MPRRLAGVRFHPGGRVYYCDPGELEVEVNEAVVVEMDWGLDVGRVVITPRQMRYAEGAESPWPVVRRATPEDLAAQKARPVQ